MSNRFGIDTLDQAAPDEGTQDAPMQASLHLCLGRLVDFTSRVEYHARRQGLNIGINSSCIARHFLKQENSSKSLNG